MDISCYLLCWILWHLPLSAQSFTGFPGCCCCWFWLCCLFFLLSTPSLGSSPFPEPCTRVPPWGILWEKLLSNVASTSIHFFKTLISMFYPEHSLEFLTQKSNNPGCHQRWLTSLKSNSFSQRHQWHWELNSRPSLYPLIQHMTFKLTGQGR